MTKLSRMKLRLMVAKAMKIKLNMPSRWFTQDEYNEFIANEILNSIEDMFM